MECLDYIETWTGMRPGVRLFEVMDARWSLAVVSRTRRQQDTAVRVVFDRTARQKGTTMAASSIEYVELYTEDEKEAADYLRSSMRFSLVAESVEPDRTSVLLRQNSVQVVVTSGPGTRDFLDAHGDGIADIALACDDLAETRSAAARAGTAVTESVHGNPTVRAFGDVVHTLLPATEPGDVRLPPGRAWIPSVEAPARPAGRIRVLDHVAICFDAGAMAGAVDFYGTALGLAPYSSEYIAVGGQAMDSVVVRSASGGVTFTLLEPDPTRSAGQIDAFLARNGGAGVQHLAFLVEDIVGAVHELAGRGVDFLQTPGAYYDLLTERFPELRDEIAELSAANVLADRDEWGYLLQLFTRSPYERSTLFYELIQRRGSRGFGSGNIKALYEAVDREMLVTE